MRSPVFHRRGFTLIEVIATLIILAILAAVAASRVGTDNSNLITAGDSLVSHLRLAQIRAMNNSPDVDAVWGIRFSDSTHYNLFYCDVASTCNPAAAANNSPIPGADAADIDLSKNSVTLSGIAFPAVIAFNRFGTPFSNADLATLAATVTLTLQGTGGQTKSITITPQTGMISS